MAERPIIIRGTPNPSETPGTEINEAQNNATSLDDSRGADSTGAAAATAPVPPTTKTTQAEDDDTPPASRVSSG